MPTLPLYEPTAAPAAADAWHRVAAPGGYEWWYFDAEDPAGDVQVVAIFLEGFVFHPGYLRQYARYRRRPTRVRPPVPGDYPCAYFVVYERGRVLAQFMTQYPPGTFGASAQRPAVRIGPNTFETTGAGELSLALSGTPWRVTARGPRLLEGQALSAELTFRPKLAHPPHERRFFSRELAGADHFWVLANPLCDVAGTIRLAGLPGGAGRVIEFNGRGYHDHNYGAGPIGPGLRRWVWGRVLLGDRVVTFHHAEPRDPRLAAESHLLEADAAGFRPGVGVRADGSRRTALGLAYPAELWLGAGEDALKLAEPRVVDAAPFYLRLTYAVEGRGMRGPATAFCEVAYPHRLRWPVLGRMIETSIHRATWEG